MPVAITAVEVASATAIQGATVEVEVTVENQGTSDANAKITLLYVPAEGEPGIAAKKTVAIAAWSHRNGHPILGYIRHHPRRLHHQGPRNPG